MKRALVVLFGMFFVSFALAGVDNVRYVEPEVMRRVITNNFNVAGGNVAAAWNSYQNIAEANNGKLGSNDFVKICSDGGISNNDCVLKIVPEIFSKMKFKTVCADGGGKCINDFFDGDGPFGGTQVRYSEGLALAKIYAKRKYGDDIYCSKDTPRHCGALWKDDCLACRTFDGKFYEFQFDTLDYSDINKDVEIPRSVVKAVCKINGGTPGAKDQNGNDNLWNRCYNGDCGAIEQDLASFGYSVKRVPATMFNTGTEPEHCSVDVTSRRNEKQLAQISGLDSFKFKNIQLKNASDATFFVKRYIRSQYKKQGKDIKDLHCEDVASPFVNPVVEVKDFGNLYNPRDQVIKCYVDGKAVEFVFDDLYENWSISSRAGTDGLACLSEQGAMWSGKRCYNVTKDWCDKIGARWDESMEACVSDAAKVDHYIQVAGEIGISVLVIYAGIKTGGSMFAVIVSTTAGGLSAVNVAVDERVNYSTEQALAAAQKCKQKSCIENALKDLFYSISNYPDRLDSALAQSVEDLLIEKWPLLDKGKQDKIKEKMGVGTGKVVSEALAVAEIIAYALDFGISAFTKLKTIYKFSRFAKFLESEKAATTGGQLIGETTKVLTGENKWLKEWKVSGFKNISNTDKARVYSFINENKTYYLKASNSEFEADRTKRAYDILSKSPIVSGAKVLETDQAALMDFAVKNKVSLISKGAAQQYWFIRESVPGTKTVADILKNFDTEFQSTLRGQPITLEEQRQISSAIDDLNKGDIIHGNLANKMFFVRDAEGKLHVGVSDFEPWNANSGGKMADKNALQKMFAGLAEKGGAETKKIKQTEEYVDNALDFFDDPSEARFDELCPKLFSNDENLFYHLLPKSRMGEEHWFDVGKITDSELEEMKELLKSKYNMRLIIKNDKNGKRIAQMLQNTPSSVADRTRVVAKQNKVNYDNLSNIDKEFLKLKDAYAPENMTLEEFKAMSDGDLDKMKEMVKNWLTKTEIAAKKPELEENLTNVIDKYKLKYDELKKEVLLRYPDSFTTPTEIKFVINDYFMKPELKKIYDMEKYVKQDKSLENIYQDFKKLAEERERLECIITGGTSFCTYNPEVKNQIQIYEARQEKDVEKLLEEMKIWEANNPNASKEEWSKALENIRNPKQADRYKDLYINFPLKELENYAEKFSDRFVKIIEKHDEMLSYANDNKWFGMESSVRQRLLQQIINIYAKEYGGPRVPVYLVDDLGYGIVGGFDRFEKIIELKSTLNFLSSLKSLAHEYGHAIDYLRPDLGVLGSQYAKDFDGLYTNTEEAGYYIQPTEQSSYFIERLVEKKLKKMFAGLAEKGGAERNFVAKAVPTENGMKLSRWMFNTSKDKSLGVKYYEYVSDHDLIQGAKNIINELNFTEIVVFERDGQHVMAIFDNTDDFKTAERVLGKKNLIYDIFSKIYYDMPEDVLKAKLKYVYEHSETPEQTVDALNMVQAFDKGVAELFIKDLSDEIVVRIKRSGDLADRMKNWDRLNKLEREAVNDELHEIVTTLRRNHVGNTIVSHETNMPGILGSHRQPTPTTPRKFEYVDLDENMEVVLTTIVHENTHAFQSLKKSTLHPYLYDWAEKVYTNDGKSRLYWDAISEQEARYVGENVTKRVVSMLGL